MHNPHFWQTVEGVEEEARKSGYDLLLAHSNANQDLEDYCLTSLSRRTISGLIIIKATHAFSAKSKKRLLQSGRPIVECSDNPSPFDSIVTHYRDATQEAMRYLLALGHRRFAFINGVAHLVVGTDRLEPFHATLSEAGIAMSERSVINCGITPEDSYQAAYQLLKHLQRPTAVVVINDLLAIGVLRAAADLGLAIPKDLSVLGFDDIPIARYLNPRLTTVHRDTKAEGQQATRMLLERLANPNLPVRTLTMPAKLILRESIGPVPGQQSG
ncbi:MAG: substrate-binding domain-containing protein [Deinococcales bacterium]